MLELYPEHCSLNPFHAVVETDFVVIIPASRTVLAKRLCPRRHRGVIGDQRSAFSISAEILTGVKAKLSQFAERSDHSAFVLGSMRLSGVFDKWEAMFFANC